jgi:hypothetical protein
LRAEKQAAFLIPTIKECRLFRSPILRHLSLRLAHRHEIQVGGGCFVWNCTPNACPSRRERLRERFGGVLVFD